MSTEEAVRLMTDAGAGCGEDGADCVVVGVVVAAITV